MLHCKSKENLKNIVNITDLKIRRMAWMIQVEQIIPGPLETEHSAGSKRKSTGNSGRTLTEQIQPSEESVA